MPSLSFAAFGPARLPPWSAPVYLRSPPSRPSSTPQQAAAPRYFASRRRERDAFRDLRSWPLIDSPLMFGVLLPGHVYKIQPDPDQKSPLVRATRRWRRHVRASPVWIIKNSVVNRVRSIKRGPDASRLYVYIYIYIYDNFVPRFSDADQIGYTGELINADQWRGESSSRGAVRRDSPAKSARLEWLTRTTRMPCITSGVKITST